MELWNLYRFIFLDEDYKAGLLNLQYPFLKFLFGIGNWGLANSYAVWTIHCLNREKFATGVKTMCCHIPRTDTAKLRCTFREHSSVRPSYVRKISISCNPNLKQTDIFPTLKLKSFVVIFTPYLQIIKVYQQLCMSNMEFFIW